MDITHHVPTRFAKVIPRLTLSDKASDQLNALASEHGVDDISVIHRSVAHSAGSFRDSVYFLRSRWFQRTPHHPFRAVKFELQDGNVTEPILIYDTLHNQLLAEDEVTLPEDYPDVRVLEETKAEYFPSSEG